MTSTIHERLASALASAIATYMDEYIKEYREDLQSEGATPRGEGTDLPTLRKRLCVLAARGDQWKQEAIKALERQGCKTLQDLPAEKLGQFAKEISILEKKSDEC